MSPDGQKYFELKASLIFGLAFVFVFIFISGCGHKIPVWHKPYTFPNNELEEGKLYDPEELDTIYHSVSTSPSYPGGAKAWNDFLKQNLKYPKTQLTVEGRVFLKASINSIGEVTKVKVIRGLHSQFNEEAKRLVLSSGKWNPATYQGKPVNDYIAFFIHFRYK